MSSSQPPAVDTADLLDRVGGSRELVAKLAGVLDTSAPQWLRDLRAAVEANDAERLRKSAHSAKGALSTLSAFLASQIALSLEEMGKAGNMAAAPEAIAQLSTEINRVCVALRTITAEK